MKNIVRAFFLIFFALPVFSLEDKKDSFLLDFVSRTWTASEGLPGNAITSVLQDDTGYLWIGTYEGLVRFDGVEFLTMNNSIDERYPFVSVRKIFQDSRGNVWVGSNDEGATKIAKDGSISSFSTKNGLPNNSVRSICEDFEGNVWLGTAQGIAFVSKDEKLTIPKGLESFGEENPLIRELYCDTAGRIWLCTNKENALYVYSNKKFGRYEGITKIKNPTVNCVKQDHLGNFWFGIEPHHAVKVSGTDEILYELGEGIQKGTIVSDIFEDKNRNMWFALDNGVTILHDGKFSYLNKKNALNDEKIAEITQDREGNIWLATDRGGIQKISLSKFRTTTLPTTINSICEDKKRGVTWLAGDDGLYCSDGTDLIETAETYICHNVRIRHVGLAKNGDLLVSTYEKLGQLRISPNGNVQKWTHADGLTGNKVRVSEEIENGDLYIGTTNGLNVIDSKSGEIWTLSKDSGLPNDYIMAIFQSADGRVWLGTDGGGIVILKNKTIEQIFTTNDGLAGNVIFKISEINGKIWICTGTGISILEEENGKPVFKNLSSKNGLGTDGIFQALPDSLGNVWLTSNRGICSAKLDELESCADGKQKRVAARYFGKSDGLTSSGVTSTSLSMQDSLNRIWFTLIDGFAIYDPTKVTAGKVPPPVQIQEIIVDNESIAWHGEEIKLEPSVQRVKIKYTGISFSQSDQLQFSTRLAGFDKDWSEHTAERSATYTNLSHGTYTFSVKADSSEGAASGESLPLKITKRPYLWELVWFWILLAIIVVGTAVIIISLRIRAMRIYEIELESKVVERTHELQLEKERSESLLLNILPRDIAEELSKEPGKSISKKYPKATVLFTDIVGFTKMSGGMSADSVVRMLNSLFWKFDTRAQEEGIEKIKTIGDAYMAASGLTERSMNDGAEKIIKYAHGIIADLEEFNRTSDVKVKIRLGIHTGALVAGVIGRTKFIYDIWGDTVNTASRMESTGTPMRIHVSEQTFQETRGKFNFSEPVFVEAKGKGELRTYYIE